MNATTIAVTPETLPAIIWQNQPVITTELLADIYGTATDNIKKNFERNKSRFIEGVHYFLLKGADLKAFKNWVTNSHPVENLQVTESRLQIGARAASLYLWTERGTVRHAKILDTDNAWAVQDKLEDFYFTKNQPKPYALRELPTPKYLTTAMKKHINRRVAWLVKNQVGATFPALGKLIQDTFNVNKREFVPYEKYREVCALLNCEPDEKALQGELLEPAAIEYQPPKGMTLVDVAELEALRRKKPFQIFKVDGGMMQYTAKDLDNNQFAMIPMDKWEDLSQAGSFAADEKLVQVKSGQVMKVEDFIEQIFQDPRHPYVIAKRDVMTSIRTLFNSLL